MAQVLRQLPPVIDPAVVVGIETGDDATVYRSPSGDLIVATLDFFTPVVDDPYDFGRIAAANSLSDVYAMGGRPIFALSIVAYPVKQGLAMLGRIMEGAAAVTTEAGIAILGGHSIDDPVPKFGLVAIGIVKPEHLTANRGTLPGDRLYLTKPLGSGALAGALKKGLLDEAAIRRVTEVMATLNRKAAEAMNEALPRAATDVTGFGLLGHLHKLVAASGAEARLRFGAIPFIEGASALYEAGAVPGGTKRNLEYYGCNAAFEGGPSWAPLALADAQTSGGLLIAIAPERAPILEAALRARGVPVHRIGEVVEGVAGRVTLRD